MDCEKSIVKNIFLFLRLIKRKNIFLPFKVKLESMDTFYNTRELNLEQKIALLDDCKAVCFLWRVDKLDCSVSFYRERIEMTYEEIKQKLTNKSHFVVIDRKFYTKGEKKHFEIAFRTMTDIDYFLFIHVEDEMMFPIIEKYGLSIM
jgi:hypothetical protein